MADKVFGEIYETRDYSKFKEIKGNRTADHSDSVSKSIGKVGFILSPILVNEKFEIIDGGNRFKSFKELGLPIRYMIQPGIGLAECISLNIGQKNWTTKDFILSYAEQGNENYKRLLATMEKHESLSTYEILCSGCKYQLNGGLARKTIESGKLIYGEPDVNEEIVLSWAEEIKELIPNSVFDTRALSTLIVIARRDLIDLDRMKVQFIKYSGTFNEYSKNYRVESLERLYNYGRHSKKSFASEFRKAKNDYTMKHKNAKVASLDENGEVVEVFTSIKEASKKLDVTSNCIVDCLSGKTKTAVGYGWKYI